MTEIPVLQYENNLAEQVEQLQGQLKKKSDQLSEALARIKALEAQQRQQQDEQYRVMFETSPAIKLLIDPETGEIVDANQAACQFYGYDKGTLLSMNASSINRRRDELHKAMNQARIQQQQEFFNVQHHLASGETRDVEVVSNPIRVKGRTLLHVIVRDMTERSTDEAERRLLWHAVNQSANSVVITDPQGHIEYVNPYFTKLTGYTLADVYGKKPSIFKSGHTPRHEYTSLWQTITSGQEWTGEFLNKKKSGELYWEHVRISPIMDADGKITNFIAIKEDVTEYKRAWAALEEKEHALRRSQAVAHVGNWTWDVQASTVSWSEEMGRICGLVGDSVKGDVYSLIKVTSHPEDVVSVVSELETAFDGSLTGGLEYRIIRPDGTIRHVWAQLGDVAHDSHGKIQSLSGIMQDITERKQHELEKEKLLNALHERHKELELLYHISRFSADAGLSIEDILRKTVDHIPDAWQYPETTCARIILNDRTYATADFQRTAWKQQATISVNGVPVGEIEVCYREPKEADSADLFLREEHELLEGLARQLGEIIERRQTLDALEQSERRFRTLVDSMDDIVFTLDREGRHTGVFGRWVDRFGASPGMFVSKTAREILGDGAALVHEEANDRALSGQSVVYDWDYAGRSIQTSLSPQVDDHGRISGIVGVGRDITDIRRVEQQLYESERFAHAIVDTLAAHIAILDESGEIIAVNDGWFAFARANGGSTAAVCEGANYLDVLRKVDPKSSDAATASAALEGILQTMRGEINEFTCEYPCHAPDELRWFNVRVTRFTGDGPVRVVVAHENITERVFAKQKLAAYNAQLEEVIKERTGQLQRLNGRMTAVLNNVSSPIILVDTDARIDITNPAFSEKLGYQPDELFDRPLWSIFEEANQPVVVKAFEDANQGETPKPFQAQVVDVGGNLLDVEASLVSVANGGGHVVCTLYDITHLKEVERIKDEFVSMVSHELRTPITSIMLSSGTITQYYDRLTDDQKRGKLEQISQQTQRLADLVTAILDVSRFDARRKEEHGQEAVDMAQALRNVVSELAEQARTKQQQLDTEIHNSVVTVMGDHFDLERVWRNLLSNAIKYTGEYGQISARLYGAHMQDDAAEQSDQMADLSVFRGSVPIDLASGRYIIGLVEDNGPGISPQDVNQLFTRFFRGWAAGTNISGTGLGLSLVRDILQYYGGDIAVSTELKVGTKFCFWLPVDQLEETIQ